MARFRCARMSARARGLEDGLRRQRIVEVARMYNRDRWQEELLQWAIALLRGQCRQKDVASITAALINVVIACCTFSTSTSLVPRRFNRQELAYERFAYHLLASATTVSGHCLCAITSAHGDRSRSTVRPCEATSYSYQVSIQEEQGALFGGCIDPSSQGYTVLTMNTVRRRGRYHRW